MKIQDIEAAVRKQLPFRKEPHLFLRTDLTKDTLKDAGMILICGLANIYVTPANSAEKAATKLYDLNGRLFRKYSDLYLQHTGRAAAVMSLYGIDLEAHDFYRQFSDKFWDTHNTGSDLIPYKTGFVLSQLLSSRREYNLFLDSETNKFFEEDDYTSFLIFNKAQLAKNYLSWTHEYMDI